MYSYPPLGTTRLNNILPGQRIGSFSIRENGYGNGVYIVSASTIFANSPENDLFSAFDGSSETFYTESSYKYEGPGNTYTGTSSTILTNGKAVWGEWLQITLPNAIEPVAYTLSTRAGFEGRFPRMGYLMSSLDGTTFEILHQFNDGTKQFTRNFVLSSSSSPTRTFRFVCTQLTDDLWFSVSAFSVQGYFGGTNV